MCHAPIRVRCALGRTLRTGGGKTAALLAGSTASIGSALFSTLDDLEHGTPRDRMIRSPTGLRDSDSPLLPAATATATTGPSRAAFASRPSSGRAPPSA